LGLQLFCFFRAASAAEKIAMIIDSIELCTACHAEGRGFEPRRSRHDFAGEFSLPRILMTLSVLHL
jgi:hypothetical protein